MENKLNEIVPVGYEIVGGINTTTYTINDNEKIISFNIHLKKKQVEIKQEVINPVTNSNILID